MTIKEAFEKFYNGQDIFYGNGRQKNYRKAFELLLIAVKHGIPHAQNHIGFCYSEGLGIKKTMKKVLNGIVERL